MNDLVKENLLSQIWNFSLSRRGASWKDPYYFQEHLFTKDVSVNSVRETYLRNTESTVN